ncbi:MAG: hypothetical protein EBQ97_04900, partial [Bacteroidetes bacterium]|nr:hypothetical protein [Bacteroidota bacterium]
MPSNFITNDLALDAVGNIYGICANTIYRMTKAGVYTVLHSFGSVQNVDTEGYGPTAIAVSSDGTVYGVTTQGGAQQGGTLYRLASDGTYTVLHAFAQTTDGRYGNSLVRASDGTLYGTQQSGGGGSNNAAAGTLYRYGTDNTFTVLYTFTTSSALGGGPLGLTLSPAGTLYGVTAYSDQPNGRGALYKRTPDGVITVLYDFNNTQGNNRPSGPVTLAADGNLYGVSTSQDQRTALIYRVTLGGVYSAVKDPLPSISGFTSGSALILGADGALYGASYA